MIANYLFVPATSVVGPVDGPSGKAARALETPAGALRTDGTAARDDDRRPLGTARALLAADPRVARWARTIVATLAVASWCSAVLDLNGNVAVLLVITFAWTTTLTLRIASADAGGQTLPQDGDRLALPANVAGGVTLWLLLPYYHSIRPDWWLWQPVELPAALAVAAATFAVCWPLRPFWARIVRKSMAAPRGSMLDSVLLSASLFLVSGRPVFVAIGIGATVPLILHALLRASARKRLPQRRQDVIDLAGAAAR